ncbi:unnamed protein product [Cladocopium goreaui]|uniref:Tyr recombinase domain-containing protein n=1 Tax=Cladocopium goreaui TaxID=2562237 RepID=A0A9P1C4B3_9DINO|nr:unnamed protein product [Cladocopium goreaui]
MGHAGKWVLRSGGIVCFSVVEGGVRFNWVTPDGCGTFTTDPNKMQVLPRRMENSQNTCDVCGHACTQVLYEFRCYPKLDNLTEQDLWLTGKCIFLERHTGVRMLDPFVAYIGKTCGQGLLGCRTSTSVIREWIRRDLLSKALEEAEQLILALEQAERLATMNELRKQAGFEGSGKMQRKASLPRPLGAPGEVMVGLRDKEDLQISVDPPPGTSLQDHVLKMLLGITWPDCVSRGNVIPDGQPSIKAFCLGATQPRFRRELSLAVSSRRMPRLTALICTLARREIPEEGFPWTSVQANKDYAARFHRDKNNLGPSWIMALGDYSDGGELFIADEGQFDEEEGGIDHEITLGEKVPSGYVPGQVVKGKLFDIRNRWQRFDGRHGHMAMPFLSGTRISLVFFTRREAFDRMPEELAEVLAGMGFRMPDNKWFDETREPAQSRPLKQLRRPEPEPAPEPDTSDDEAEDGSEALEGQPIKDLERFASEMKVDWRSLKLSVGVVSCNAGLAAAMAVQQLLPAGTSKASVVEDSDAMMRWAKNFKATQGFKDYKVLEQGKAICHVQFLSDSFSSQFKEPFECPVCSVCPEVSEVLQLPGPLDQKSVLLGVLIGLAIGPTIEFLYLLRQTWRIWVQTRLVESLRRELASLRALVGELKLRLETLEAQSEFSVVGNTPPSSPGTRLAPEASPAGVTASSLGPDRVAAAQSIGAWLKRCLAGQRRGLSGREKIQQASENGSSAPEELDLDAALLASGEGEEFDREFQVLVLKAEEPSQSTECILISRVDGKLLLAVPEAAWHKKKKDRSMPPSALQKVVKATVACCVGGDRNSPEGEPTLKIWLGLLQPAWETQLAVEGDPTVVFPPDGNGVPKVPFADALIAVARDHFTFLTAGEEDQQPGDVETRMGKIEETLQRILAQLPAPKGPAPTAAPLAPAAKSKAGVPGKKPSASPAPAAGLDPTMMQQALQAGVSPEALGEVMSLVGSRPPGKIAPQAVQDAVELTSDEDGPEPVLPPGASGSADPLGHAVLQLSKIVTYMHAEKKQKKDRSLEAILDRAESGAPKDSSSSGSSRSHAAALRSLQRLLVDNPKLIYQEIERLMAEDWEQGSSLPGVSHLPTTARGWLEHRSKIGAFAGAIRPSWIMAGAWDDLRAGHIDRARARLALGVAAYDQQAYDKGSWLLSGELSLENHPPYGSFASHPVVESYEAPHTKLIDGRWFDLIVSKLKGIATFQEQKIKLAPQRGKRGEELTDEKEKEKPKKPKPGKGGGKKGDKSAKAQAERCWGEDSNVLSSTAELNVHEGTRVPGAAAPTCNVLQLWNSMARLLLASSSNFAVFLKSLLGATPPAEGGTAQSLWPMSLPYPEVWRPELSKKWCSLARRARKKSVNLVVALLNWLHMSRPTRAPAALALGSRLSKKQWRVVEHFERLMADVAESGDIDAAAMGRSAAKVEGLDEILIDLQRQAVSWTEAGYEHRWRAQSGVCTARPWAAGHCLADPGVVVGKLKTGAPVLAKSVDATRLSVPNQPPEFDPSVLFGFPHKEVYVDPVARAMEPASAVEAPPKVRVHASRDQALQFVKFLDDRGLLTLAPAEKVRRSHLCGAFGLVKDLHKDRLILDARPANMLEDTLHTWGPFSCGLIIDDIIFAEQLKAPPSSSAPSGASRRLSAMCAEYERHQLRAHPGKTFRDQTRAEFWGAAVDGKQGLVRPSPKRLVPLLSLTSRVAALGFATVALLEILAGCWVNVLQYRRRALCLLDSIYTAQLDRCPDDVVRLAPCLVDELWSLAIVGPIIASDLRAQSMPKVFLSDASETAQAVVAAEVPQPFARELQRHCLSRGGWSKLLSPWKVWLKSHGKLEEAEEMPSGVPLVSHPLWLQLARSLQFESELFERVRKRKHINLLELEIILKFERQLALEHQDVRYNLASDSQVTLACLVKGRSSSPHLNRLLQRSLPSLLGSGIYGGYGFIPSLANVADDPTREHEIRAPVASPPEWLLAAFHGQFEALDVWLEERGYDPLAVAELPFAEGRAVSRKVLAEDFIPQLRAVQKPESVQAAMARSLGALPELSEHAKELLRHFPRAQFFAPGGRRAGADFKPACQGVLDLYSGASGVARYISRKYGVWVLTIDYEHGPGQNLLDTDLQARLMSCLEAGCFAAVGAAPDCSSFSRAVTPAVRDAANPFGRPGISANMQEKVARGNQHALFIFSVVQFCDRKGIPYWVENPDGSFLWLLPYWVESSLGSCSSSYRFDQCRFHAPWRKRTRVATNTDLAGIRELCQGGHQHQILRGRSSAHACSWTRVAQTYPRSLCRRLGDALMRGVRRQVQKLDIAGCARTLHARIGEASHPGPRHAAPLQPRDPAALADVRLIEPSTAARQDRMLEELGAWLRARLSEETINQLYLCPALAVSVLKTYALHLFASGRKLYELRYTLIAVQHRYPHLRSSMAPVWAVVSKWELYQPLQHRKPLPELLFKAMFVLACLKGWTRWSASLLLGFEGIARIGEILAARRHDLLLPSDLAETESAVAFLKIRLPKTRFRGRGRVQHLKIRHAASLPFLERVFGALDPCLPLFPLSAHVFRKRWDLLLDLLQIPGAQRPTPASIRGGGAILAYRRGEPIADILWRMRLASQPTLASYLQELAAESLLAFLAPTVRQNKKEERLMADEQLGSVGMGGKSCSPKFRLAHCDAAE